MIERQILFKPLFWDQKYPIDGMNNKLPVIPGVAIFILELLRYHSLPQ